MREFHSRLSKLLKFQETFHEKFLGRRRQKPKAKGEKMKFSYNHRVSGYETDLNSVVNVTSILRYAQEAANLQHLTYGPTIPELRESGKAFILSRIALDYINPIRVHDELVISTWLNAARGFGYTRYTMITRNGETCVKIVAQWGVMDIALRHPIKVDEVALGFTPDDEILEIKAPLRIKKPENEPQKVADHIVCYGDCDENVHLNNAIYPLLFCNHLPTMVGKTVSEFSINYHHEARLGTKFDLLYSSDNGAHIFKTLLESGEIGTEARMVLKDI